MEDEGRELECPLDVTVVIVSVPQGKYKAVEFVENKKPLKKIETVTANPT